MGDHTGFRQGESVAGWGGVGPPQTERTERRPRGGGFEEIRGKGVSGAGMAGGRGGEVRGVGCSAVRFDSPFAKITLPAFGKRTSGRQESESKGFTSS